MASQNDWIHSIRVEKTVFLLRVFQAAPAQSKGAMGELKFLLWLNGPEPWPAIAQSRVKQQPPGQSCNCTHLKGSMQIEFIYQEFTYLG